MTDAVTNDITPDDILRFWFDDIDRSCWFKKNPEFDRELVERFGALHALAMNGELEHWCETPNGCLAVIILLDQFSRNMFRDKVASFASDERALQLTLAGIDSGIDKPLTAEQRSFFYMPFRHSERLDMQELGLVKTRELNAEGYGSDKYALNHLELIQRFGRFPHRNHILGRNNTAEEEEYLKDGNAGF